MEQRKEQIKVGSKVAVEFYETITWYYNPKRPSENRGYVGGGKLVAQINKLSKNRFRSANFVTELFGEFKSEEMAKRFAQDQLKAHFELLAKGE